MLWALIFLLNACDPSIDYRPKANIDIKYKVFRSHTSSSQLDDEEEKVGTRMDFVWEETYQKNESGVILSQHPISEKRKGWNKDLLPEELQNVHELTYQTDFKNGDYSYTGWDSLPQCFAEVVKAPQVRDHLLKTADAAYMKSVKKNRILLMNFLKAGRYLPQQHVNIDSLKNDLTGIHLDSVVILKEHKRLKLSCLDYVAYYHKKAFPDLALEEFFANYPDALNKMQFVEAPFFDLNSAWGKKFKNDKIDSQLVEGRWKFSLDVSTARPCYESSTEKIAMTLSDERLKQIRILLYEFGENIYVYE